MWLDYISLCERNKVVEWTSRKYAIIFMIINYSLGALVFSLPGLMFNGSKDTCLAQTNDLRAFKY